MLEMIHDAVAKAHSAMDELIAHISAHKDEFAKVNASVEDLTKKVAALQQDAADHSADDLNAAEIDKNDAAA